MAGNGPTRHWPPLPLLPEFVKALLGSSLRPIRILWRRSWLYRRFLGGRMPDRVIFHPHDALPRRLEDAEALLHGRFHFAGDTVEIYEGSIFDKAGPSRAWLEALHEFAWLPPLALAGGEPARKLAANLMSQWTRRYGRYAEPSWSPHVLARRLIRIFAHGRFVLSNSDMLWRSKIFVSLREQSRHLARVVGETPDGVRRFEAASALVLSGACLDDSPKRLAVGLAHLEAQIARQILPDGGHVTRSPEALLHVYHHIVMVMDTLGAINHPIPSSLRGAHDRIAPMIRFFRHGDGALALFNGGKEGDARMIASLLARDDVRGQPFVYAPHSAYQRLVAGRTLALLDVGTAPKSAFSTEAHAGALALEFSTGGQRVVVNCGSATTGQVNWDGALRGTAAHSTITLADASMATVLPRGLARELLGPRLMGGPMAVASARQETQAGWRVEARHDGYQRQFGIMHSRAVTLAPAGNRVVGTDTLTPGESARRQGVPFAARFHIHPDIRCSISQGGDVLLKLPNGEGWRFRTELGPVALEDSIYLGGDMLRRCEQIVLAGTVKKEQVSFGWAFEQIGNG